MEKTLKDLLLQLLPLKKKHQQELAFLKTFLTKEQLADAKYLLKTKRIGLVDSATHISKTLAPLQTIKQFNCLTNDVSVQTLIKDFNRIVKEKSYETSYKLFAPHAQERMLGFIAPNILGMDDIKYATLLLLFSKERFHLLLLGDPGTGKTDILRSANNLAPISSFGLGSGTSGAGLSVSMQGKEVQKGLLLLAHKGVCCIDELNLMKKNDRAALYSAMEKGIVTYDKATSHKSYPAQVRILATANPTGDRFVGQSLSIIKQQIPFDTALLSRFHLVYIVRKPDMKTLVSITRKIITSSATRQKDEDIAYLKDYVAYAHTVDVEFDKSHEPMITDFIETVKSQEQLFVVEIGPRLVHGIMRLAQARARLFFRTKTTAQDVTEALQLVRQSLFVDGVTRQ